jgi:hypothetical protein
MINAYGCHETNPIPADYLTGVSAKIDHHAPVCWSTPGLTVTRLRLLCDRLGSELVMDVSYCHGELDGAPVLVALPFSRLAARRWKSEIVEAAREARVYAKGLGILDNVSILY